MAAPVNPVGTAPTLTSGAEDAAYKINMAGIEHAEGNLFGGSYGTTGEIGGTLGERIAGINRVTGEEIGPNYATKGELGGKLGEAEGTRTRALSARAGANTQSGLYGTERAGVIQGFAGRAHGIQESANERIKNIEIRAREAWEADQFRRAKETLGANTRYTNYVNRNPIAVGPPPAAPPAGPSATELPTIIGGHAQPVSGSRMPRAPRPPRSRSRR